jgi:hypothetical protein
MNNIMKNVNFGEALEALKDGKRVRRKSWAANVFLYFVPGSTFQVSRAPLLGIFPEGTEIQYNHHIDIAVGNNCAVWQPSQSALIAEDWMEA